MHCLKCDPNQISLRAVQFTNTSDKLQSIKLHTLREINSNEINLENSDTISLLVSLIHIFSHQETDSAELSSAKKTQISSVFAKSCPAHLR